MNNLIHLNALDPIFNEYEAFVDKAAGLKTIAFKYFGADLQQALEYLNIDKKEDSIDEQFSNFDLILPMPWVDQLVPNIRASLYCCLWLAECLQRQSVLSGRQALADWSRCLMRPASSYRRDEWWLCGCLWFLFGCFAGLKTK